MKTFMILAAIFLCTKLTAQKTFIDSIELSQTYYRLGVQYKDGNGVPMDYAKAFGYFTQAANLGDAQSIYAVGYMHYKGLGCTQDYPLAASLFASGVKRGMENSMYFYGLCWRNGYGVIKNEDSAIYWLQKSADLGYAQAFKELKMNAGENSNDSAKLLLQEISNAAIPANRALNQYSKIENHLPPSEVIAGMYHGYIVQYDWSGKNAVSSKTLSLHLTGKGANIEGYWYEEGSDSFKLKATLKLDSILFENTKYKRKDHYSPDSAIRYNFENARLNLVQKGDSIFLAGNIAMFSPDRKEPSKPLFVALVRTDKLENDSDIVKGFRVSPNPFNSFVKVEFTLPEAAQIEVQLLSITGAVIYRNPAGNLGAGHYVLPLQPGNIASGTYIVKILYCNTRSLTKKVIKI